MDPLRPEVLRPRSGAHMRARRLPVISARFAPCFKQTGVHMAGQETANSAWTCIDQSPTRASPSCASHQQIHKREIHLVLMASPLRTVWHVKTAIHIQALSELRRRSLSLWELPTVGMLECHIQPSIEQRDEKRTGPAESWTSTRAALWSSSSARFELRRPTSDKHTSLRVRNTSEARSTRSTSKQSSIRAR